MGERRRAGVVAGALVLLAGLVAVLLVVAAAPPKPSLPYPSGQSLGHVRGNCKSGNEVLGCDSLAGPRSFLQVRSSPDVRTASDRLFAALSGAGWKRDDDGLVAADYSQEGAAEDIQPVFCKDGDGCVGLFRYETSGFVLAWWSSPAG